MTEHEVDADDIENLLNEIEENEKVQQQQQQQQQEENDDIDIEWDEILKELKNKNMNFIKNLISSKQINVNTQNPENGKTLLIYAVIIGDFELVKTGSIFLSFIFYPCTQYILFIKKIQN